MKMINSLKHILSLVSKADYEFSLIDDGDKIAVGVSGGKDSMLMLKALKLYSLFPNKNFTFYAVFLDLGFGNVDQETLKTLGANPEVIDYQCTKINNMYAVAVYALYPVGGQKIQPAGVLL